MVGDRKYLESNEGREGEVMGGVVTIALGSLLATFFLFGRSLSNSFKSKFFYWLKSMLLMALLLFAWFAYNEPASVGTIGVLMSVGLAAVFTLGRSCLVALL